MSSYVLKEAFEIGLMVYATYFTFNTPFSLRFNVLVVYVYSLYCMFRKSRFETGHDQFLSLHIYNILMRLFEHIMARDIAKALNPVPKCHGLGSTQTGAKRVKHIDNWNNSM